MCEQTKILMLIKNNKGLNKQQLALAEAQAKDYLSMKARLDNIESDVSAIKTEQARQGGMIEAIFNRLNSPVEQERLDGQKWNILTSITKNKAAWIILIIFLIAIALAGERIVSIIDKLI